MIEDELIVTLYPPTPAQQIINGYSLEAPVVVRKMFAEIFGVVKWPSLN